VEIYELIGRKVRARREELGLTQLELASKAGTTRSSISNLEIGTQRMPLEQLIGLARHLTVDYRVLLPTPSELPTETPGGPLNAENVDRVAPATAEFIEKLENLSDPNGES
jgi:transcriptional regulator with XRE-family HTH domain